MTEPLLKTASEPRYLYVHTFGCQMNEYDSLRVQRILAAKGYLPTPDMASADVIFLNTCSVRDKAEQKVHSFLGRLKRLKVHHPSLKIILGGCVAQQLGEKLLKRFDHLDLVMGTRAISSVGEILDEIQASDKRLAYLPEEDSTAPQELFEASPFSNFTVSAPVTIMQGCNNFCTYCIVPYVRGRERSRPSREILDEINRLTSCGTREVLLLGQNVNSYGRGLQEKISFVDLLHRIEEETGVRRLRFTTSHPKDLTDELIRCFADMPVLCKYLHLPFQAGSDSILQRMNRNYTAAHYLEKIRRLREACPEIGLSSDVIVGFPGETEEDFQQTLHLLETIQYDNLFSFRYSDRPYARAAQFPHKVDEETKARRLIELQAFQAEITLRKNRAEVGAIREILVEGPSKTAPELLTGRTQQNRLVHFQGSQEQIGRLLQVRIRSASSHSLTGEPVSQARSDG
ncbi:tRNA (N6-isopentenyl adenosine(37)-C2)-methylthiotransferase MiaB [Desulforhabdus amnigena]|uniref:tRNA-2-methylthio-N(6)-dimethylallyladenosine synthase n=1 Tax=Desulforhabdus amnigena TaxID=40218 RepID=A0A9W6D4T9_9BACT|nr:tRNA (N6-isopentenyl adenosine(37)-C2)-methylthiotransferase MiaB [Desulforhabdus amnigena]GLI34150.1 tRNA-2-methylthio-N(6)-dimethylallyladenosine synthase [Desulforhabdus amnigena]